MDDQDRKIASRKIYSKGFFDGAKAAGGVVSVNPARLYERVQQLTGIERKAFEVLETNKAMTVGEVVQAVYRATSSKPDFKIIAGVMDKLVSKGVAREVGNQTYQREVSRDVVVKLRAEEPVAVQPIVNEEPLIAIRRLSGEIVERLDEIEKKALAIEHEKDLAESRNAKASQLAELLKDFK